MDNTKEEVFKIYYNSSFQKLPNEKGNKVENILNNIKNHKLFTTVIMALIIFSTINLVMIYSFINLLKNITF